MIFLGTYEAIASEYYDLRRHPTCANFHEASGYILSEWLKQFHIGSGWLCEVGPGKSLLAKLLAARDASLDRLILVDSSRTMLDYSKGWASKGAHLLLGDALRLPIVSESLELLVSSLGDPYNKLDFWKEVYRVLRPGGISFFTTPSYEWAVAFRSEEDKMWSEFELKDGSHIRVPSLIYSIDEQFRLIEDSGLQVNKVDYVPDHLPLSALKLPLSPKLLIEERGSNASIVTGYVLTKAYASRHKNSS